MSLKRFLPPTSEAAQALDLRQQLVIVIEQANVIKQTQNMHRDNLAQYSERMTRLYKQMRQEYPLSDDPNVQYYNQMINLAEARLDKLRAKHARIMEMIK